jgi:uncharacterized membrane protein
MRSLIVIGYFLISGCGNNEAEVSETSRTTSSTNTTATAAQTVSDNTNTSFAKEPDTIEAPPVSIIKRPSGIYQFLMLNGETKVLHTVAFYPGTFRLQEEYMEKRDSVITTKGTWSPSQGFIWLYKEQLVRGRYNWKGDTLQYYSPALKKSFSMTKLTPADNNPGWQQKRKAGAVLFGVGTEPFWSVEISKADTLIFSSPEWTSPLKIKLLQKSRTGDSSVFTSVQDSMQVAVYPFFCNDGMSDFIYTNKINVTYKGRVYQGCGQLF